MRYLVVAMILALCVTCASAAESGSRPWISVTGAFSNYAMGDVNDGITNADDEINSGFAPGASLGITLKSGLSLGLGYEYLMASTELGSISGSLAYKLPAHTLKLLAEFSPAGPNASGLRLGAALGVVRESGSVEIAISDFGTESFDLTDSSGLVEAFLGGEWWSSPRFALTGSAGYRYAKVGEPRSHDIFQLPSNIGFVDYSGVFLRAGLKLSLAH